MVAEAVALGSCPYCGQHHADNVLVCPTSRQVLPLPGRIIDGKFRLRRQLGEGGMSTVWEAENVLVRKFVAIKMLLPEILSNPNSLSRFRNEATSAGRIGSPHICDILDFGQCEAGPFIVMEMLKGGDLAHCLERNGRLEPGSAVMVIRQALRGLVAAHKAGIIHRDLKPENLFLHEPEPGHLIVKLMDFGISKFTEGNLSSRTATGVLMGTPAYMSPEQIQGAANADERTDIWAMGVILYTAIAGHEPFGGDTLAAVLMAVTAKDPQPLIEVAAGVPPGLNSLVMRCMAKHPAQRPSTAVELLDALEPFENTPRQGLTLNYNNQPPQGAASRLGSTPVPSNPAHTAAVVPVAPVAAIPVSSLANQGGAAAQHSVPDVRQGTWALGEQGVVSQDSWELGRQQGSMGATMGSGRPLPSKKGGIWAAAVAGLLLLGAGGAWWAMRGDSDPSSDNLAQNNATSTAVIPAGDHGTSAGNDALQSDTGGIDSTAATSTTTTEVTTTTLTLAQGNDKPKGDGPDEKIPKVPSKIDPKLVREVARGVYIPIYPGNKEPHGNYSQAKNECSRMVNVKFGGLRQWRLPTVSQLKTLLDQGKLVGTSYWSASTDGTADGAKFVRKALGGKAEEAVRKTTENNRFICVAKS